MPGLAYERADAVAQDAVKVGEDAIKVGWLAKEGERKLPGSDGWKRRWCAIWPTDYADRSMPAPFLVYYEGERSSSAKGAVSLAGAQVTLPKSARKGQAFAFRVNLGTDSQGKPLGDGVFRLGAALEKSKLILAAETEEGMDEWQAAIRGVAGEPRPAAAAEMARSRDGDEEAEAEAPKPARQMMGGFSDDGLVDVSFTSPLSPAAPGQSAGDVALAAADP